MFHDRECHLRKCCDCDTVNFRNNILLMSPVASGKTTFMLTLLKQDLGLIVIEYCPTPYPSYEIEATRDSLNVCEQYHIDTANYQPSKHFKYDLKIAVVSDSWGFPFHDFSPDMVIWNKYSETSDPKDVDKIWREIADTQVISGDFTDPEDVTRIWRAITLAASVKFNSTRSSDIKDRFS